MDNFRVDVTSEGLSQFTLAMELIFRHECVGYRIDKNVIHLYWADSDKAIKLPYKYNVQQTINFVWGWLEVNPPTGKQPDHDGDNGKGFRLFNESWGHADGTWQAFASIEPIWAMYGK